MWYSNVSAIPPCDPSRGREYIRRGPSSSSPRESRRMKGNRVTATRERSPPMHREKERFEPREKRWKTDPESGEGGDLDGECYADASRYSSRSTLLKNFHPAWDAAETISERDRNGLSIVHSEDLWQKSLAAHKSTRVFELCANVKRECGLTRDYSLFLFFFFCFNARASKILDKILRRLFFPFSLQQLLQNRELLIISILLISGWMNCDHR